MILETERLYLREMTEDDFPALCLMLQDPEVMYAYGHAFSDEEAHQWLDKQLDNYLRDGFGLWAMILKESGEMIGRRGLTIQDCAGEEVLEVGVFCCARSTGIRAMLPRRLRAASNTPLPPSLFQQSTHWSAIIICPLSRWPSVSAWMRSAALSNIIMARICRI